MPNKQNATWNRCEPPANVLLKIKCSDCRGEYTMKAMRVDYKRPKPGQGKKGFRKGWRWVKESGNNVTRKEAPEAWAYL